MEKYGLKLNPYDLLVKNNIVDGHQMTVMSHVENLKLPHKEPIEFTKIAHFLSHINGKKITIHQESIYDYLDIDMEMYLSVK